jgi:glycine hydroxymethyltransferase
VLAATHQVNRVAALAVSAAEMLAFGEVYMAQIVRNARALAAALDRRGVPVLGKPKGYTSTHQVIVDVRRFGGGSEHAQRLAAANIITNKNLIPEDRPEDWDSPGGLRLGTIEVTRLGMGEAEMEAIGDFIVRIVSGQDRPEAIVNDVVEFRAPFQTLYYCFENGFPPQHGNRDRSRSGTPTITKHTSIVVTPGVQSSRARAYGTACPRTSRDAHLP